MNKTNDEKTLQHCTLQIEPNVARFYVWNVLDTCERLRHKISVLNRRLQRVRTENKRLQMRNEKLEELLLDYVARQIPD